MSADLRESIADELRRQASRHGFSLAVLYGSAVRDPARARDVDIAIDAALDLEARGDLAAGLSRAAGRFVDLVLLRPGMSDTLRFEVFRAGVPLFEAQPGLFAEARRRAVLDHWDEGPYLRRARLARIDRAIAEGKARDA